MLATIRVKVMKKEIKAAEEAMRARMEAIQAKLANLNQTEVTSARHPYSNSSPQLMEEKNVLHASATDRPLSATDRPLCFAFSGITISFLLRFSQDALKAQLAETLDTEDEGSKATDKEAESLAEIEIAKLREMGNQTAAAELDRVRGQLEEAHIRT